MPKILSEADRRAVDLVLDQSNSDGITQMVEGVPSDRLNAVETVLNLVGQMTTPEPAGDLVARTLNRLRLANRGVTHSLTDTTHGVHRQPPTH